MSSIMDRLFPGRKPRTPASIKAALAAARETLLTAQARAANAIDRRKAAIASGDRSGAIAAEAERAAAEIDSEIASGEIAGLEAGLAEAVRVAEAAAKAATKAALAERRRVLGDRFETEWRRAAAVLAEILSEAATLSRDISEGGFRDEVERLPEISRGLSMHDEAISTVSKWLGDALASPPTVPESPNERAFREHKEARARREAERKAASDREAEEGRERLRASREAERQAEAARSPFYPSWRDHMDSAR